MTLESKQIDILITDIERLDKEFYNDFLQSKNDNKRYKKLTEEYNRILKELYEITKPDIILNFVLKNLFKQINLNQLEARRKVKSKNKKLLKYLKSLKDKNEKESNNRRLAESAYFSNIIGIAVILFVVIGAWIKIIIYKDDLTPIFNILYWGLSLLILGGLLKIILLMPYKKEEEIFSIKNISKSIVFGIILIIIIQIWTSLA